MNERLKVLAEQAEFDEATSYLYLCRHEQIERFAELVRAEEREACAELCDEASLYFEYDRASPEYSADYCAKQIRARSKK